MRLSDDVRLRNFSGRALYRGFVYRCLGHCFDDVSRCYVEPIYDGIYASWSKSAQLDDVECKLYGPVTRMVCKISEPRYGIDLSAFGASRGFESEVVFLTLQDCVIDVKYVRVEGECELL